MTINVSLVARLGSFAYHASNRFYYNVRRIECADGANIILFYDRDGMPAFANVRISDNPIIERID